MNSEFITPINSAISVARNLARSKSKCAIMKGKLFTLFSSSTQRLQRLIVIPKAGRDLKTIA